MSTNLILILINLIHIYCQIAWTPIYIDTTNQLDLWTLTERGCPCQTNTTKNCACCTKPGGCLCTGHINRCTQCGLEDLCQRFCNVTLTSWSIISRSHLQWLQLKSPNLQGPTSCYYRFEAEPGQRIEIQVHRIINIGAFGNETGRCTSGSIQLTTDSKSPFELCGENSRFSPPIVFFADQGVASLVIKIPVKTVRSQLLSYVSFVSADDPIVGDPEKGGQRLGMSSCDWSYTTCHPPSKCIITSTGYPGLVKPLTKCHYHIKSNTTGIRLTFHSLSFLDGNKCTSHHLSIWKMNKTKEDKPLKFICSNESVINISTNNIMLEYYSGTLTSYYVHNGFKIGVEFVEIPTIDPIPEPTPPFIIETTPTPTPIPTKTPHHHPIPEGIKQITCGHVFTTELTRGLVYRLLIPKDLTLRRSSFGTYNEIEVKKPVLVRSPFKCQVEFHGKANDIVQLGVFNYKFRGSNCSTILEIYDLEMTNHRHRLAKLCGPIGNQVQRFTSSYNRLVLVVLIYYEDDDVFGSEFLEGAFRFHDETIEGTVKPMSNCEVVYYGVTSLSSGIVTGPPDSPLLLLSTYPLICTYTFQPNLNQSITLTLNGAGHDSITNALPNSLNYCRTICGNSGCICESKYTPLDQIDHLLIINWSGQIVSCLCGYFKDILPLSFESNTQLTLIYHAIKKQEFTYSIGYQFKSKITCTNFTIEPPNSSKRWKEIITQTIQYNPNSNLYYIYFQCIWSIKIPEERYKLLIDFISEENESNCHTWNLTILSGNNYARNPTKEDLLYTFCPKDGRKEFTIENTPHAFLKLDGLTQHSPKFDIRWKYVDLLNNFISYNDKIITNAGCLVRGFVSGFVVLAFAQLML